MLLYIEVSESQLDVCWLKVHQIVVIRLTCQGMDTMLLHVHHIVCAREHFCSGCVWLWAAILKVAAGKSILIKPVDLPCASKPLSHRLIVLEGDKARAD